MQNTNIFFFVTRHILGKLNASSQEAKKKEDRLKDQLNRQQDSSWSSLADPRFSQNFEINRKCF